jgi:hypothetical protein
LRAFSFQLAPPILEIFARNTLVVHNVIAKARHLPTYVTGGIGFVIWVAEEAILATPLNAPTERQTFVDCLLDRDALISLEELGRRPGFDIIRG